MDIFYDPLDYIPGDNLHEILSITSWTSTDINHYNGDNINLFDSDRGQNKYGFVKELCSTFK